MIPGSQCVLRGEPSGCHLVLSKLVEREQAEIGWLRDVEPILSFFALYNLAINIARCVHWQDYGRWLAYVEQPDATSAVSHSLG